MKTETMMILISMKKRFHAKSVGLIARSMYKDRVTYYNLTMSGTSHMKSFAVADAKKIMR